MTKLEEKLIELGYKLKFDTYYALYVKHFKGCTIVLNILKEQNNRIACYIDKMVPIYNQQDIDNLQLAYNELQKDLEALKEYEK